eukprot:TRINITY_DN10935_c0_g1_i1.p2 TRINITY_DN10935_c0_g1~~TRINITY_DN10935_c0_g1_i1.p2  ORF type:complete len:285 (-),score=69.42 TRINITY_DN10935_c0_g1_i1:297-1151(-)
MTEPALEHFREGAELWVETVQHDHPEVMAPIAHGHAGGSGTHKAMDLAPDVVPEPSLPAALEESFAGTLQEAGEMVQEAAEAAEWSYARTRDWASHAAHTATEKVGHAMGVAKHAVEDGFRFLAVDEMPMPTDGPRRATEAHAPRAENDKAAATTADVYKPQAAHPAAKITAIEQTMDKAAKAHQAPDAAEDDVEWAADASAEAADVVTHTFEEVFAEPSAFPGGGDMRSPKAPAVDPRTLETMEEPVVLAGGRRVDPLHHARGPLPAHHPMGDSPASTRNQTA